MWPGFGENMRVLEWMIKRCNGEVNACETAIGQIPFAADINVDGLSIDPAELAALLEVDSEAWLFEMEQIKEYLSQYGDRLPAQLLAEVDSVVASLAS